MLDLDRWPNASRLNPLKALAREYDQHPLNRGRVGELARRLMHNLTSDARYEDDPAPPGITESPRCHFAPALLLRKRTQQGLVEIFRTVIDQLREAGSVPDGLRVLLDPDQVPRVEELGDPAKGWVEDGSDVYLPLPVNDQQLEVVRRVDRRPLTLVQGPPGTGKTHTAAALISHLLAQGQRVLVTAQTDRALKEVRAKLPPEIRDLSVSIVGAGRDELSDLRVAVSKLSQAAAEYDPQRAQREIEAALGEIERLKKRKAELSRQLLETREAETLEHDHAGYCGTLAAIAARHARQAGAHGWLASLVSVSADDRAPMSSREASELLRLLRDPALNEDEPEANKPLPELARLPDPDAYAALLEQARRAAAHTQSYEHVRAHEAYQAVASLVSEPRTQLRERITQLADRADELSRRNEPWLPAALQDIRAGRRQIWHSSYDQLGTLLAETRPLVDRLGPLVDVQVDAENPKPLLRHAQAVKTLIDSGRPLRVDRATRKPRRGLTTPRVVRDAEALFDGVRVDGDPPTTGDALETFILHVEATTRLAALDSQWPSNVVIPKGTLGQRLAWHEVEHSVLAEVMALGADLDQEEQRLSELGIPRPDWSDLDGVRTFAHLVEAADAADTYHQAEQPLLEVLSILREASRWEDTAPGVRNLAEAAERCDATAYRDAHRRMTRLFEVRRLARRRDELLAQLRLAAPRLAERMAGSPGDEVWTDRMASFDAAWRWCTTAAWIRSRSERDVNALQASFRDVEDRIRRQVTRLAATRAWNNAIDRLGPTQRADLTQYAQLVARFGKGKTKYAAQRQAGMRDAMRRCRPSVPVWIMPLYRIGQSLQVDANLFDVVIVDEASQAGLEATFLQYLAPRIVVIGDDKQVSPRAVGVDQAQLIGLAKQLLYDDRYKDSWLDPKRSLFDEARMRFGDLITLTEHRRCVPDIIGFSNRIAYEPDGIRPIPVRQTGSGALDPIRPVHVTGGFTSGGSYKTNQPEIDAIVEQVEKCFADDRYNDKTFGVISLTGEHQARAIEKELMDRIDPREWQARDLRCGTASDFQGSERDVMFLSMVAAREEGRRVYALTKSDFVQQFNVAASRAKDQMWVFHSPALDELSGNKEDMRFALLDYCYGVARRREEQGEGHSISPVPEDHLQQPFESLFEQRVHNRLFDQGYTVIPQYPVEGYRIDLVVVGAKGKLAVECDGDRWHGPEQHQTDLARQRDLERCGWRFFRVRESEFTIDPVAALAPLWEMLDAHGIHPADWSPPEPELTPPKPVTRAAPRLEADRDPATVDERPRAVAAPATTLARRTPERPAPPQAEKVPAAGKASEQIVVEAAFTATRAPEAAPTHYGGSTSLSARVDPSVAPAPVASRPSAPARPPEPSGLVLNPYQEWDTTFTLPDPGRSGRSAQIEAMRRIVAVEGPILGERLYQLYVKSAGGQRVGREVGRLLNAASAAAVRKKDLIADNPLRESGQKVRTFRLPEQPEVIVRELGPRSLGEVPMAELASVLRTIDLEGRRSEETLFRALLDLYGLKRLTDNVRTRLRQALSLTRPTLRHRRPR